MQHQQRGEWPRSCPPQPASNPFYLDGTYRAAWTALPCPASEATLLDMVEKRHQENVPGERLIALEEL